MPKVFTVANRNGWRIVADGFQGMAYDDLEAAVDAAIVRAKLTGRAGMPAEVVLERPNGQMKVVWRSGEVVQFPGRGV
jgi:hypothetical protein